MQTIERKVDAAIPISNKEVGNRYVGGMFIKKQQIHHLSQLKTDTRR